MADEKPCDGEPAVGAGLMQGAVPAVVSVVDLTELLLQAARRHFLEIKASQFKTSQKV